MKIRLSGFVKLTYPSAKPLLRSLSLVRANTTTTLLRLVPVSRKWVTAGVWVQAVVLLPLHSILEPQNAFSLRRNGEAL